MKENLITHTTSAPYHPATNGLAERFVQSFKQGLRAVKSESGSLERKLARFLLAYRNAPHATMGETPAMLFMGRRLRTRLDGMKPDPRRATDRKQDQQVKSKGSEPKGLAIGEQVMVREYTRRDTKWVPGVVHEKSGPRSYEVKVSEDRTWRRHLDQIRPSDIPIVQTPPGITPSEVPTETPPIAAAEQQTGVEEEPVLREVKQSATQRRSGRRRKAPDRLDL